MLQFCSLSYMTREPISNRNMFGYTSKLKLFLERYLVWILPSSAQVAEINKHDMHGESVNGSGCCVDCITVFPAQDDQMSASSVDSRHAPALHGSQKTKASRRW